MKVIKKEIGIKCRFLNFGSTKINGIDLKCSHIKDKIKELKSQIEQIKKSDNTPPVANTPQQSVVNTSPVANTPQQSVVNTSQPPQVANTTQRQVANTP